MKTVPAYTLDFAVSVILSPCSVFDAVVAKVPGGKQATIHTVYEAVLFFDYPNAGY